MSQHLHSALADQADRDRFASELAHNFSVIAPAGVGKTTAIVARVAALAQADAHIADPVLPRLAVVTYTRKAAEEMQSRARARLLAGGASPEQLGRFSQAFFGTIHSLCLLVLKSYGHLVGLPSNLEQTTRLEPLWRQYLRSTDSVLHHLPEHARTAFLRHGSLADALELVLKLPPALPSPPPLPDAPVPDISAILQAQGSKNKKAQQNIEQGKLLATSWLHELQHGTSHLPLPAFKLGGKDFAAAFENVFRPLCDWLGEATLLLARAVAEDFRAYRKAQGKLTFDDMITWAAAVLDNPQAGERLRQQRWCVILDEAQDTDPLQFHVLLSLAGASAGSEPANAPPAAASLPAVLPPAGRFCMVGDPQQAIYGERADLATYRNVHEALLRTPQADALHFTVTMRCDSAIVDTANAIFPNLLREETAQTQSDSDDSNSSSGSGSSGGSDTFGTTAAVAATAPTQVAYVPLRARPAAGVGKVSRLSLTPGQFTDTGSDTGNNAGSEAETGDDEATAPRLRKGDSDRDSARTLARTLAQNGPEAFGLSDWSELGILCVRNEPLSILAEAIEQEGLLLQNHSRQDIRGDSPAYAWLCGLARIMAEPEDAFEAAGVLREVFGLSDGALYAYTCAAGSGGADAAAKRRGDAARHHPLALSAGALALSTPQPDAQDYAQNHTQNHAQDYEQIRAVGAALELLRNVRAEVTGKPLREGIQLLSKRLELPRRLNSLPDGRNAAHLQQLDNLLLEAAASEERDFGWPQWADALEENFDARIDSAEPLRGHIQLLSCHKSKGLQWPVVMLANLFREVGYATNRFPRLLFPSRNQPPVVAFSGGHGHGRIEQLLKRKERQELERLAYVACTRAQRQMIWVDDSEFYAKTNGSFAEALGITEGNPVNAEVWAKLPLWQPQEDSLSATDSAATAPIPDADTAAGKHAATASEASQALTASGPAISLTAATAPRPDWTLPFFSQPETPQPAPSPTLANAAPQPPESPLPFIRRVLPSSLAIHNAPPPKRSGSATVKPEALHQSTAAQPKPATEPAESTKAAAGTTTASTAKPTAEPDAQQFQRGHARDEPDGSRALPSFAELEAASAAAAGANYGNWWHKAMELAPWGELDFPPADSHSPAGNSHSPTSDEHSSTGDAASTAQGSHSPSQNIAVSPAWEAHTRAMLAECPDPQRGAQELERFLGSALFTELNQPHVLVRCELPLLWREPEQEIAYDGFIDLVARDTASGQVLLIDWKTDRLSAFADPAAELLRCYGPQLDAYRKALRALFDAPVLARLYNTPSGLCPELP